MIRIEKYLSEQGVMSRREAQAAIKNGWIYLNGKKIKETGIKMDPAKDKIDISDQAKKLQEEKITVAINKPRGVLSSKDTEGRNVFNVFPQYKSLNCVGRLDKESEGLLLLSNDGMITKAITSKDHNIEKEYIVEVRENFLPWMGQKMVSGIKTKEGILKAVDVNKIDKHNFSITLLTGRKHQIRRMADAVRLTIVSLKRVRIGKINLGNLKTGMSRKLKEEEIKMLKSG